MIFTSNFGVTTILVSYRNDCGKAHDLKFRAYLRSSICHDLHEAMQQICKLRYYALCIVSKLLVQNVWHVALEKQGLIWSPRTRQSIHKVPIFGTTFGSQFFRLILFSAPGMSQGPLVFGQFTGSRRWLAHTLDCRAWGAPETGTFDIKSQRRTIRNWNPRVLSL